MIDVFISPVLNQLISIAIQEATEPVTLVVGVNQEVEKLTSNIRAIQSVLVDAEKRQVKEETVRLWLDQLKDTYYDMEDVLDEWNTARLGLKIQEVENALFPKKKVRYFIFASCFGCKQVFLRHDIAFRIKKINEKLDDISKQKDKFTFNVNVNKIVEKPERVASTSFVDVSEISGRVSEKNALISKLVSEGSGEQNGLQIISIVGMGGIGKTTLAQLAYNHDKVKINFEKRIWVCVSDPFDQFKIAKAILEALEGSASNLGEFQSLMEHIEKSISGKKFLLILDDVWTEDYNQWEPFYNCLKNDLQGSKILITTRKEPVAVMMRSIDIINVQELSENESWSLFRQFAFFNKSSKECEELEEIGRKIVAKCKGLPLAAKTIGSLLLFKKTREEWQNILKSELWKLEEVEKNLLAPLLLSYYDLPSIIKRCFSYCATFPKDYNIEKDELIKLWMAQGYLTVEEDKEMEIIGQEYFDILATRSFFQEFTKDDDNEIISCKMHDIVHDFTQFLCKNECFTVEINGCDESFINSFGEKIRHLLLALGEGGSFPISICKVKRLRSLLIYSESVHYSSLNNVLPELFSQLTCLRALYMTDRWFCQNLIKEIPATIGKLIYLRYLNLSGQEIEKLPEKLCELYNLQILDVSRCKYLRKLPKRIGKLINLRYLLNNSTDSLRYMPVGIARLTSLRIIEKFVVGGSDDVSQSCSLESLKSLNLLRECHIDGLGNVSDVGEAKRSELKKKKNLRVLSLSFFRDEVGRRKNEEDEQLLEALQPPPNLETLEIKVYRGCTVFPNWMMSLTHLRVLRLWKCKNCEHLPPLGKLPSLEKLDMFKLKSVKRVGNEFFGGETDHGSSSSSSFIAFPRLKSLEIVEMNELEEWDYGNTRNGEIMPKLSSLAIYDCPKFKALPDHLLQMTTLQNLTIWRCPTLKEHYGKRTGEDWPKISHIPSVQIYS